MWLTSDTTSALARSRTGKLSFGDLKKGVEQGVGNTDKIATTPEALAAVIPTGIAAAYTLASSQIGRWAVAAGETERSARAVKWRSEGRSERFITRELNDLPLESAEWLWLRVVFFCLVAVVVLVVARRAAREGDAQTTTPRGKVVAEPAVAVVAFIAWALVVPGTPLGAVVDSGGATLVTTIVAASGGFLVYALGFMQLTKPAR